MGILFDILLSFSIWPYITKFIESLIPTSTQGISCSLGCQQSTNSAAFVEYVMHQSLVLPWTPSLKTSLLTHSLSLLPSAPTA